MSQQTLMTRTDLPYVVAILFAILSWAISHSVDRLLQLPLVKVAQTLEHEAQGDRLTLEFENITKNINFRDLTIVILGETRDHRFTEPKTKIVGSGWDGSAKLSDAKDSIVVTFSQFHPGWGIQLTTTLMGGGKPKLQLKTAAVPTILVSPGWRTYLIEWELAIIGVLGLVALGFIVVWVRREWQS